MELLYKNPLCCFHNPVQFMSFIPPAVSKPGCDAVHDDAFIGSSVKNGHTLHYLQQTLLRLRFGHVGLHQVKCETKGLTTLK